MKIYLDDPIAAVSTPVGNGGIGIVRISGKGCVDIADKIFVSADGKKLAEKKSHTISYGKIYEGGRGGDKLPRRYACNKQSIGNRP